MTPDDLIDCIALDGKAPYWVLVDDLGDTLDVIMPNGRREKRRKVPAAQLVEVPLSQLSDEQRTVMAEIDSEADRESRRQSELAEFFTDGKDYIRHNLRLVRDEINNPRQHYGVTPDDGFIDTIIREQLLTYDQLKTSPALPPVTDFWLELFGQELRKSFEAWLSD